MNEFDQEIKSSEVPKRKFQFSLRTFVFGSSILAVLLGLFVFYGIPLIRFRLIKSKYQAGNVVSHQLDLNVRFFCKDGRVRRILVFDPALHSWPGSQPIWIVLTDDSYREIERKKFGGSPSLEIVEFKENADGGGTLFATFAHRFRGGQHGVYRFKIESQTITELEGVRWIKGSGWSETDSRFDP